MRHAVQLLFAQFEQTRSALAVVKHFAQHRLLFPDRLWGKTRDGELVWKPLRHGPALDVLHNPRYTRDGTTPSYECNQVHKQQGGRTCQFVRGDGADAAVTRLFLDAIQPAQLHASLATLEEIEDRTRQVERQWELRRGRARYEADLARHQFLAVEPENRLVARTLEKDWNEKLAVAEQLEREQAASPTGAAVRLRPDERQRILGLTAGLPALWHAPTTTPVERKQLLRLLLTDVTLTKEASTIRVALRWQTDVATTAQVPPPHGRAMPVAPGRPSSSASAHWPRIIPTTRSPPI